MINPDFGVYLKNIYERINKGDAREESFYSALEKLFLTFGNNLKKEIGVYPI